MFRVRDTRPSKIGTKGTGVCVKTLTGHKGTVTSALYIGDGKKILSASDDSTFKEWDAGTGQCLKIHKVYDNPDISEYTTGATNIKLSISGKIIYTPATPGEEKESWLISRDCGSRVVPLRI